MAAIGKQAWFALMNRKSRTAARRSPVQTRPRLLTGYRAPAAAGLYLAPQPDQLVTFARPDQASTFLPAALAPVGLGDPVADRLRRLARTRGQDRPDHVRHEPDRPSGGETPANTVGGFLGIGNTSGKSFRVSTKPGQSQLRALKRWAPAVYSVARLRLQGALTRGGVAAGAEPA